MADKHKDLGSDSKHLRAGTVVDTFNPNTWKAETDVSWGLAGQLV